MRVANVIVVRIGTGYYRCPSGNFSIKARPRLSTEAAPSAPNGLRAHAEPLRQFGSCTSPPKMVQVYNACQAHLDIKAYCLSISFIIQLWSPWGTPKQNHCWSETVIVSAPPATYLGQNPYENSLRSWFLFLLVFNYRCVGFPCFPFLSACCFSQS